MDEAEARAPVAPPALASVAGLDGLDDATLRALAERLAASGFCAGLLERAERSAPGFVRTLRLPLLRAWLRREGSPGALLARVFACSESVEEPGLRALLGDGVLAALLASGWLRERGGAIDAPFELVPSASGAWVLADPLAGAREAVMGPGPGTEMLARLLGPDLRGLSVLDLGCGAGTLALAAARRGAHAVATDVNPRALALARFNARLGGVAIETLAGGLYEPVRGRVFDRIVVHPPFVVRPAGVPESVFLHGGRWGDELALAAAAGAAAALAPGGRFVMLMQSAMRAGGSFVERLGAALGEAPVDRAVLQTAAPGPAVQSMAFGATRDPSLGAGYAAAAAAYADHFAALGIESVGGAIVVLSRPPGNPQPGGRFFVSTALEDGDLDHEGFGRWLAGLELAALPDARLLARAVRLPPGARLATGDAATLHPAPRSVGAPWRLDAAQAAALEALDRAPSVAAVADGSAAAAGRGAARDALLDLVRAALARGALVDATAAGR